jgi:hypothetical protein
VCVCVLSKGMLVGIDSTSCDYIYMSLCSSILILCLSVWRLWTFFESRVNLLQYIYSLFVLFTEQNTAITDQENKPICVIDGEGAIEIYHSG